MDIVQGGVISVGNDGLAPALKFGKVVHHQGAKEGVAILKCGFIDHHVHTFQGAECLLYHGLHLVPVQATIAASQRGDGDAADVVLGNDAHQILQAGLNPLVARGVAPVLLGG